ncbi:MAG: uroporphyrinogen decarboxylase family protein [Planctomycetota bacterium]
MLPSGMQREQTMNSFERYIATVKGGPVDHLARAPILMAYAAHHTGAKYGEFASDHRVLVEANMRSAEDFDFDQLSAISDPYRETQGFGAEIEFVEDGVPRCVRAPLEESKDLASLAKPDPRSSVRMLDRVHAIESFKELAYHERSIMGWIEGPAAEADDLRGVMNFLMDVKDDERFTCELMDLCTEAGIAFARAQIEAGADTIGIGDAIVSQVSPETYRELILPREKRMVEAIHNANGLVRLHICGDITRHLPAIAGLGADIVDLDWQVDVAEARSVLGPKTVLVGNLDPVAAVKDSSPEEIRRAVLEVYGKVGDPHIVGAGCEIPPGTPPENLRSLCEPVTPA